MAIWRYATPEECVEFAKPPEKELQSLELQDIFPVFRGVVQDREGKALSVPEGKWLKLLQGDGGEPWVYKTLDVEVLVQGRVLKMLPETLVAVFSHPSTLQSSTA